jgi:hypothetical protein
MRHALPLLLLLAVAASLVPGALRAEVRRCVLPGGQTVYTDRRCDAVGGIERRAGPAAQSQSRLYRSTCARTVRDLYYEVSAALEARDVNRLAGVYHWPGMSTREGYDVMRRLQAIVDRGFVDLQPVYPGGDSYASTTRPPYAFRIEQVAANGRTPLRASLSVRRHLECWWVSLGGDAARPAAVPAPGPRLEPSMPARPAASTPDDSVPPQVPDDVPAR